MSDPLHGITLERIVKQLEDKYGWEHLGYLIPINCFIKDPSVKSSLKFLRKTEWARKKVENLYIEKVLGIKDQVMGKARPNTKHQIPKTKKK